MQACGDCAWCTTQTVLSTAVGMAVVGAVECTGGGGTFVAAFPVVPGYAWQQQQASTASAVSLCSQRLFLSESARLVTVPHE